MSEGNLLDQQQLQLPQQSRKFLFSSKDSELELLSTGASSPEVRSRSQSVGSAHREALLFFEQHRLFQNSPELDFVRDDHGDCELRSISSASRHSSPAIVKGSVLQQATDSGEKPSYQQRQQKAGFANPSHYCHQQQVQNRQKSTELRQQSESNLLDSGASGVEKAASFLSGGGRGVEAYGGASNQTNNSHCFDDNESAANIRGRSQSQGQCGSLRRRQDSCSSVIVFSSKENQSESNGTQTTSKWLEEIQFKAQYQHYRTNNYASVVSSASSLDKSDGGINGKAASDGTTVISSGEQGAAVKSQKDAVFEAERPSSSSARGVSSSQNRSRYHQFAKCSNEEDGANEKLLESDGLEECIRSDSLNRQNSITTSQCWNFPRVKLKKLFAAKSLDDILGGSGGRNSSNRKGDGRKKSLQVATSAASGEEKVSQSGSSGGGEKSSSSSDSKGCVIQQQHTKKAQLRRDNKLSLPRFQHDDNVDDKAQLLLVKHNQGGSQSPGARSSKSASATVISSTLTSAPSKQRKGPVFLKATRQKSRSFSALTSVLLNRVQGHNSSSGNSPSATSVTSGGGGASTFFKRGLQDSKNVSPVVPTKKSGHIVSCAKSENCINRIVASATCSKFVDYFSADSYAKGGKPSTTTLVEPFALQSSTDELQSGPSSYSTASSLSGVVTAQPRKWTAIKNKWDQKLQASGDRQKEIGASLASVSNNAQIFRKSHQPPRQRSSSLSPLDNPDDGKSIESLLEITSPSPTLQEVRFLDTPEIRYASPVAVRSSRSAHTSFYNDDEDEDNNEEESVTLTEGTVNLSNSSATITGGNTSRPSSRASSACSSCTVSSYCSDCREREEALQEELDTVGEMTRHGPGASGVVTGGTKRSRDHHHRHHGKHHGPKEKPKLVVANVTYLQRPMSPGLLLRESSPSSGASGGIESFGALTVGNGAGAAGLDQMDGNYPQSVIRNNNLTNKNNNQQHSLSTQYKSQQAKLEFLKSFSPATVKADDEPPRKRDPLCAKIVNVNEGNFSYSPSDSDFISPSSSSGGGASDNRSGGGIIGANNPILGRSPQQGSRLRSFGNDLQDITMKADYAGAVGGTNVFSAGGVIKDDFSSGVHNSSYSRGAGFVELSSGAIDKYTQQMRFNYGQRSAESQSADSSDRRDTSQPSSDRKDSSLPTNQAPQTLAQQSSINNNLLIDVDFEGSEDTMGDLQSPQYVKRTAHMFDSRFSSEPETNGHERNARNPSYLNVSRSVSGYSCLSYNNGSLTTETVTNKTILGNGASLITSGTRVSPAGNRIKTDFSLHSPFTRGKVPHTDDDSSDHSSNQSATSPPPSLPPINTTSAHGRITDSPFFQNGINRGEDLIDDTPYIPSHGKSFIMQRIERLYGSDAVSSKGAIRKSSNVTTISISREPAIEGKERIIPIKVESRDDHQNNVFNNDNEGVILPIICSNDESGRHVEPRCTRLPINDSDEEETDSRSENRRSPSKSLGHLNGNANRYRNDGNVTKNGNEVRANVSPTERKVTSSLFHANGASRQIEEDCTLTKKVLSRESSAGSVDSNECSDNSLELGSISSEVDSQKFTLKRLDSTEDGIKSSGKPKPKPKPKDMALLRTFSRSPGLKTGTENLEKTGILSMVQHDIIKPDSKCDISSEDHTDGESYTTLSDIKNTITTTVTASSAPSGKTTPAQLSETIVKGVGEFSDKENGPHQKTVEESANSASQSVQTPTRIVKDGNYFLNEMKNVTSEILKLAEKAAVELETIDESEDRAGSIHAAIGKGNLLVKKKFPQFEGLCHANLKGSTPDEPETTNEDLAGFWDMVMIQVDQVYSLFADLEKKDEESPRKTPKLASPKRMPASTSKSVARPTPGATPKVNSAAAKARDEARRKLIAERRKAMKNQMQETQESDNKPGEPEAEVQIFTPGAPHSG